MSDLIAAVHAAFRRDRTQLVPHGEIRMVATEEVARYRKLKRTRENALAPGKVCNRSDADLDAGRRKWDELMVSMQKHGFDPAQPVEFRFTREAKLKLHQGHHRVGVALELGITEIPVRFLFEGA